MATPETLDELEHDACMALLRHHHLGRVGYVDDRGPVVLPVNYVVDGDDVLFRSGPGGKLDAARLHASVALEVDHVDAARRTGWSVLVRGDAEVIATDELGRLAQLGLEARVVGDDAVGVRIRPWSVEGRRINLPPDLPRDWLSTQGLGHVWRGRDGDDLMG